MKRSGFTMIELIFVIVILGILASVAIPKLAATRDDAKVSKALSELATLKSDLSSYYTSQGKYDTTSSIKEATNIALYTDTGCSSSANNLSGSSTTYYYCTQKSDGSLEPAVAITLDNTDGNLTISDSTGSGNIASGVQAADDSLEGTILNGGSRVSF